tara:strand:+ start:1624 stop:2304 length:681 start_codon:yes stop_codon:yes gene_type:complete
MKKIAILQSNYIPWKGYFDLISKVDEFIIYDDVQFTKNDWRNRNKIKTPKGLEWITIPVGQNIRRKIKDVVIFPSWQKKHWKTLQANYSKAKFFKEISEWLEPLYLEKDYKYLSEVNIVFIKKICQYLQINTKIENSSNYKQINGQSENLVNICIQSGAKEYISGPSAKNYIIENLFEDKKIKLTWFNYGSYKRYEQLWGNFDHNVSILDLIFNLGNSSKDYIKQI